MSSNLNIQPVKVSQGIFFLSVGEKKVHQLIKWDMTVDRKVYKISISMECTTYCDVLFPDTAMDSGNQMLKKYSWLSLW